MSQQTKKNISDTLVRLLEQKSLDQITIRDITDAAGVNRSTFYYHFKDIYDLMVWTLQQDEQKLLREGGGNDTREDKLIRILKTCRQKKTVITNIYHSINRETLEHFINVPMHDVMMEIIEEECGSLKVREDDKEFIADFYKYALTGIVLNWIGTDMKEDPESLAQKLLLLTGGNIRHGLLNYSRRSV